MPWTPVIGVGFMRFTVRTDSQSRPQEAIGRASRRALRRNALAVSAVLVAGLLLASSIDPSRAEAGNRSFAAGSLLIPMDTDISGNHASFNQNLGMWKAYGLVFKLLQNGVPVYWGIKPTRRRASMTSTSASVRSPTNA